MLRGAMTPRTRQKYATAMAGSPRPREDAWQRAVEFLFERLAVGWRVAGAEPMADQKELLARFRFASIDERRWIRDVLREHLAEHFPDCPRRDRLPIAPASRRCWPATAWTSSPASRS